MSYSENSIPIYLPGVHAYAEKSVASGQTIHFRVSSDVPYHLCVCRLGPNVDDPSLDEDLPWSCHQILHKRQQPIYPGSYVYIEKSLSAAQSFKALTLECWIRPWRINTYQGLITQYNYPHACGFGLFINSQGQVQFYFGDGGAFHPEWLYNGPQLNPRQWHHLVCVWSKRTDLPSVSLWVDGKQSFQGKFQGPVSVCPGTAPLRLGACADNICTSHFLDGDLAMPVIYGRALSKDEIEQRYSKKALETPNLNGVLGCWLLSEERGDKVADISRDQRHGRIINHATWMIGGPSFVSNTVARYGNYDPTQDARRGHSLRFASDDLYDCGWEVTDKCDIPEDAKPGIYVGRIRYEFNNKSHLYDITFIIRKAEQRPKARILMLCSSNTWLAYNAMPFVKDPERRSGWWATEKKDLSVSGAPAYNCYLDHESGQPTYQLGVHMPWPVAGPYVLHSSTNVGFSHLVRAERFVHIWLDQNGYDYDVVTDFDLHRDPAILKDYKVLIINGHSEYWSIPAYNSVDRFLCDGGSVIVLSGNTMFWRVSFDKDGTVMECRKFPVDVLGSSNATVGELYHSHDSRRGGLMRECGYPAWSLFGLECVGYWSTNASNFEVYHTEKHDHFLFNQPNPVSLKHGDTFGHASNGGLPKAVGHEFDVRVTNLPPVTNIPVGANLPVEPPGIVTLAVSKKTADVFDYFAQWKNISNAVVSEVIYWERPQGGLVFCVGTVGAGWTLSADPKFQALIHNVLHHFGVMPKSQTGVVLNNPLLSL